MRAVTLNDQPLRMRRCDPLAVCLRVEQQSGVGLLRRRDLVWRTVANQDQFPLPDSFHRLTSRYSRKGNIHRLIFCHGFIVRP
jgi:hypothetical protein